MSKGEHQPRRSCLGCGAKDAGRAMLRLVVRSDGGLKVDREGTGRGGYLHKDPRCWQAFLRRKSLYRAYRMEIGRGAKEKLIEELNERRWE